MTLTCLQTRTPIHKVGRDIELSWIVCHSTSHLQQTYLLGRSYTHVTHTRVTWIFRPFTPKVLVCVLRSYSFHVILVRRWTKGPKGWELPTKKQSLSVLVPWHLESPCHPNLLCGSYPVRSSFPVYGSLHPSTLVLGRDPTDGVWERVHLLNTNRPELWVNGASNGVEKGVEGVRWWRWRWNTVERVNNYVLLFWVSSQYRVLFDGSVVSDNLTVK